MKKLILVLAAALALSLLCSCAKPLPEEPVQADPEPEAPAEVHVTTFTADILSSGGGTLTVKLYGTKTSDKTISFSSKSYTSGKYKYASLYKTVTENGKTTTTKVNSSAYLLNKK